MQRMLDKLEEIKFDTPNALTSNEWIELIEDVVKGTDTYWASKSWGKSLPDGIKNIANYIAIYKDEKKPSAELKKEFQQKQLTNNPVILKQLILSVLAQKTISPKQGFFSSASVDDKDIQTKYSRLDRTKATINFYAAVEKLLSSHVDKQQAGKKELLLLKDRAWKKSGFEKIKAEEILFLECFGQLLDSLVNHMETGKKMPATLLELKAANNEKEIKLTEGCKRKFNFLKEKLQQISMLIEKIDSPYLRERYTSWFTPIRSAITTCSCGDFFNKFAYGFISFDELKRINKVSAEVNALVVANQEAKMLPRKQLEVELSEPVMKQNLHRAREQQIEEEKNNEKVIKTNTKNNHKIENLKIMVVEAKPINNVSAVVATSQGRCNVQEDIAIVEVISGLNKLQNPSQEIPVLLGQTLLTLAEQFENEKSGAVYALSLLYQEKIYTFWVGNVRVYLSQKNKIEHLTWDHQPNNERDRLLTRTDNESFSKIINGYIHYAPGRGLDVSRIIGGFCVKSNPYANVISTPSVTVKAIEKETSAYLILSCDGIRDRTKNSFTQEPVMSPALHVSASKIQDILEKSDYKQAAQTIIETAFNNQSHDNMTTIVVNITSVPNQDRDKAPFFCIIDGHGGIEVANKFKDLAKEYLQKAIDSYTPSPQQFPLTDVPRLVRGIQG